MPSVAAHWQDFAGAWPARSGWDGLELTVSAPARPGLVVQAGPGRRMRLAVGAQGIAWARVNEDRWGTTTVVARDVPRSLPPITAALARAIPGPSGWARWLARQLLVNPASPLHQGTWWIARGSGEGAGVQRVQYLEQVAAQQVVDEQRWDFQRSQPPLALRRLGAAGDAERAAATRAC